MNKVGIVDYGLANIRSVVNALSCFGVELVIAECGKQLNDVDKIVLPGVGSFDAGMKGLNERGHSEALTQLVREQGRHFLGICLGFQFLFEGSDEGKKAGLGWLPGRCERFPSGKDKPKVPHMGWSDINVVNSKSRIFTGLLPPFTFYFVHSYFAPFNKEMIPYTAAICEYGFQFTAAVEYENIFATQFHPEKSQLAGMKLLETFLERL